MMNTFLSPFITEREKVKERDRKTEIERERSPW